MAEAVRSGRLLNLLFAAWVIASPWVLPGAPVSARWNDLLVGIALIVFTVRRGPVREHYAGWDRLII